MKRKGHEREREIRRLRDASHAWQEADRELEAIAPQRERIDRFKRALFESEDRVVIQSVDDVPTALRAAWKKSGEGIPDLFVVRLLPEYQEVAARKRAAHDAIYTPEFLDALKRLKHHRPSGVDRALVWLEANPLCFHSGYDKQRLMRYLRHVPLTLDQQQHLRSALLVAVREGAGVEFRDCCRTARLVDTPRFRRVLVEIRDAPASEHWPRQRATWMLDALVRANGE